MLPGPVAVTATLSNVDVLSCVVLIAQTTRPTYALLAMFRVVWPTCVQDWPLAETDPVTIDPARTSLNHAGAAWFAPASHCVVAPVLGRVMNSFSPSGLTSRITCAELSAS